MKVIHFIVDDKFINGMIDVLDEMKEFENRFYILSKKEKFEYITSERVQRISETDVTRIIKDSSKCDIIVIHGLLSLSYQYIREIDERIKVVWLSWGYDIYTNNTYPHTPLLPIKNQIKSGTLNFTNKLIYYSKWFVKEYVMRILRKEKTTRSNFIPAISRIDYFSGVYPAEYDLIKANNPFFKAKPITFHYLSLGTKTRYRKEDVDKIVPLKGRNIQVGHNAAIYGNHRNTFYMLKDMNLDGRKIITPLSYPAYFGYRPYVSSVCKSGYSLFKDNFIPMKKFVPIKEYREYMSSISVAIFNFDRQAAAGNIIMNLWNGTMVFLPEKSIGYKHFKSLGFHIYTIEHDLTQEKIDMGLTEQQIIVNRQILSQTNTYEILTENIIRSFRNIHKSTL